MSLLLSIAIFVFVGGMFVFVNLKAGALFRPSAPNASKAAAYECGEPTIGSSWVQFDLRFYIVALVYLVFDVEVALFYPWAVAWGDAAALSRSLEMTVFDLRWTALADLLFFFGVLLVGFAYLWRFGYLDWVRSAATTSVKASYRRGVDLGVEARVAPVEG
jgi:NADH-quinone oxidoreductase subunit A